MNQWFRVLLTQDESDIMIYEVLNYLRQKLDVFLSDGRTSAEPLIVLSNPWTNADNSKSAAYVNAISLINVEEEKIFKSQLPQVTRYENGTLYTKREPDVKLNLYLLFSSYNKNYEDALKLISRVVGYFQANSVFTNEDPSSVLPSEVDKIVMELFSVTFEQQNQIWASLSTGYLPSVIYKVKTLTVDVGRESEKQKSIQNINIKSVEIPKIST